MRCLEALTFKGVFRFIVSILSQCLVHHVGCLEEAKDKGAPKWRRNPGDKARSRRRGSAGKGKARSSVRPVALFQPGDELPSLRCRCFATNPPLLHYEFCRLSCNGHVKSCWLQLRAWIRFHDERAFLVFFCVWCWDHLNGKLQLLLTSFSSQRCC